MNIEDYKKTSFLANVSYQEIKEIVEQCGYSLVYRLGGEEDGQRQTIEKIYDSKNRKVIIEVCAKNKLQEELHNRTMQIFGFGKTFPDYFSTTILRIEDYSIYDMLNSSVSDNSNVEQMQKTYASYMYNKFGERYRQAYNRYITRQINKNKEEEPQK